MRSVSIEDLQENPNLVAESAEAVEITHNGAPVGVIGGVDVPIWQWETTEDDDYVDDGGATEPERVKQIREAVENDYWRG